MESGTGSKQFMRSLAHNKCSIVGGVGTRLVFWMAPSHLSITLKYSVIMLFICFQNGEFLEAGTVSDLALGRFSTVCCFESVEAVPPPSP